MYIYPKIKEDLLTNLSIKNFALIEDVSLQLQDDFTIITGETGAGKSILLGALSLLIGKRADIASVRNPDKKCMVEGHFKISVYQLENFFVDNDLDYEPETIIRREILPSGKSRAFINDTPVTLQKLVLLGNQLIDIHSQHETLSLGEVNYQFKIIDDLANHKTTLVSYKQKLNSYKTLLKQLEELKASQKEAKAAYDYNLFLVSELQEANLKEGIQEELEEKFTELNNVEELKENLSASSFHLEQEEIGVLAVLRDVKNKLSRLENFSESYKEIFQRVESSLLELEDVTEEIVRLESKIEDDPEELTLVNQKLQQIYNLQRKHDVETVEELLVLQNDLEKKVASSENADEELTVLEQKIEASKQEALALAQQLYKTRKKEIPTFISKMQAILAEIGMPDARLKIEIALQEEFNAHGIDKMNWLLAANKGGSFKDIKKAASGGELSRITLAVKSILAFYGKLPTIIFDEIDTGVSGDVAQKMGNIMLKMSQEMQVIAITHLPQIAAKGKQHLKVYKETKKKITTTNIEQLSEENRILELAEMLGGKEKSNSAIAHAKQLLN